MHMINTDTYKQKLVEERTRVVGELQEADENVSADRAEDWLERTATLAALETRYNSIERALEKIDNGTYGMCELCGAVIEADRLDANPGARTCKKHINDEQDLPA
jgi:RNA polymerase-binding transcription factor DksA